MPNKNGKLLKCKCCGKMVYIPKGRWNTFKFCSYKCHAKTVFTPAINANRKGKFGKENWRWKPDGCKRKDGYVLISVNGKRYFEHRYIMEQHLGRKLSFNETVHHLNGNREDNRLINLELNSRSEHTIKYHRKKRHALLFTEQPIMEGR